MTEEVEKLKEEKYVGDIPWTESGRGVLRTSIIIERDDEFDRRSYRFALRRYATDVAHNFQRKNGTLPLNIFIRSINECPVNGKWIWNLPALRHRSSYPRLNARAAFPRCRTRNEKGHAFVMNHNVYSRVE